MAQCMGSLFMLQANLHKHYASQVTHLARSKGAFSLSPFSSRTNLDDSMVWTPFSEAISSLDYSRMVVCFREDDGGSDGGDLVQEDVGDLGLRSSLEVQYSPWAVSMMKGFGRSGVKIAKESTGGPPGGSNGGDDGGGGDGGDDGEEHHIFLLPLLTLVFAAFQLGYCVALWFKDDHLDFDSFKTGLGLFCLLAVAAIRLKSGAGLDAYVLGLGASLGVMFWTGERCLVKKDGSFGGIVALFAASMAVIFTAALYHNI